MWDSFVFYFIACVVLCVWKGSLYRIKLHSNVKKRNQNQTEILLMANNICIPSFLYLFLGLKWQMVIHFQISYRNIANSDRHWLWWKKKKMEYQTYLRWYSRNSNFYVRMCLANAFGRRLDISWHRMLDAHIYIWFPLPIQLAIFDTHTDTKHTVGFMPLRYWNTFCSSSIQFFSGKEEQIQKKNRAIP